MKEDENSYKIVVIGTSDQIPSLLQQGKKNSPDETTTKRQNGIASVSDEVNYLEETDILHYTYWNNPQEEWSKNR